jgi:Ca-activated chloride channel family protein
VLVPTTVVDSLNRPVKSLQMRDFTLYDGDEPQVIKYFNQEDAPISFGILLDTSGSMKNKYHLARQAVAQLFANSNLDDDYFVITFADKPAVLADTTQSPETIEAELSNVEPSGGTPLLDAIYLGLDKLKDARHQRRALVIISDGGDNSSRYRAKEIRALAQESDVQIYAMGIFSALTISIEDRAGKKLLSEISDATGGRAVFLSSAARLPEVSTEFSRELRSQYVLGYQPSNLRPDGKLHKIKVKLTSALPRPLQVYYRREYLASR